MLFVSLVQFVYLYLLLACWWDLCGGGSSASYFLTGLATDNFTLIMDTLPFVWFGRKDFSYSSCSFSDQFFAWPGNFNYPFFHCYFNSCRRGIFYGMSKSDI